MSKQDKERKRAGTQHNKDMFDSRLVLKKYLKRYGIVLLISLPFLIGIGVGLSYTSLNMWVGVVLDIVFLLIACIIGLVIFNYTDRKKAERPKNPEKERDPFAD